jgi:hypothetical protein
MQVFKVFRVGCSVFEKKKKKVNSAMRRKIYKIVETSQMTGSVLDRKKI